MELNSHFFSSSKYRVISPPCIVNAALSIASERHESFHVEDDALHLQGSPLRAPLPFYSLLFFSSAPHLLHGLTASRRGCLAVRGL